MEEIDKLMELCRSVMNGEEAAEDELDLQSVSVNMPKKTRLTKGGLQREFTAALILATAARKLKKPCWRANVCKPSSTCRQLLKRKR